MQEIAFFYYTACLAAGFSSMAFLAAAASSGRDPFLSRFIPFSAFYALLLGALAASAYLEAHHAAAYGLADEYLRLLVFLCKCGLAFSLVSMVNVIFAVRARRAIDIVVFCALLCALALRLVHFSGALPEEAASPAAEWPVTRITVDAILALGLAYLLAMRLFRLERIASAEYRDLVRLDTLIIAAFSPLVAFEVLFFRRWGMVVFSPALYAAVSAATVARVFSRLAGRARSADGGSGAGTREASLREFAEARGISAREAEVLGCLLLGHSNREIADELCVSLSTVKAHVYSIFKKCGVRARHRLYVLFSSSASIPKS
jgi:DNA-binding CsgD family transcriptional regulator